MAQYLTEIFGDKLNLSSIKADVLAQLPSPEALKGRILVKVASPLSIRETFIQQLADGHFLLCSASMSVLNPG